MSHGLTFPPRCAAAAVRVTAARPAPSICIWTCTLRCVGAPPALTRGGKGTTSEKAQPLVLDCQNRRTYITREKRTFLASRNRASDRWMNAPLQIFMLQSTALPTELSRDADADSSLVVLFVAMVKSSDVKSYLLTPSGHRIRQLFARRHFGRATCR